MKNKISLSGLAGSGKTSIGKMLADKLGYDFISIGNYSRDFAERNGMNINEFQNFCLKNPNIDLDIDKSFSQDINNKENQIIDYRLAHKFVDNCFHVYLQVSELEAATRLVKQNRILEFSDQDILYIQNTINTRNFAMKQRFIELYNTDFTSENNYDLVVNTDATGLQVIANHIVENFKRNQNENS